MGGRNKGSGAIDKGPGYAGQYSIETVDFWLNDPRLDPVSPTGRAMLLYLGLISVSERREILPKSATLGAIWARMGGSRAHTGRDSARVGRELELATLIDFTSDGRVIVCGSRKRRPNLKWKDEGDIVGINGYISHQAVSSKQEAVKETEEYAAGGRDSRLPKKGKMKAFQGKDGRWLVQEVEVA